MNSESRTTKSVFNIGVSVFNSFLLVLLNYIGRIIFVRYLDASYLGINGLFSNVISILSIADLGIATALTYSLYKPIKEKDTEKINVLIYFFKKVYTLIALAVFVFGLVLMPLLPFIVNLENTPKDIYIYYILFVLESASSYLFSYKATLLTADQKNYYVAFVDIGLNIFKFLGRILIVIFTQNYVFYVAFGVASNILFNFFKNLVTTHKYKYLSRKAPPLSKEDRKIIFSNVGSTFLYKIGGVIQTNTDSILISIYVGTIMVGYYSNYTMLITSVTSLLTMLFSAIKASLGNFIQNYTDDKDKMYELYKALDFANFWLIGFCSIAFICLFQDFTRISYGEEYLLPILTVILIVVNFYTSNIRQNMWAFRETTGLFNKTKYITLVTSGANLILSIIFGYFFGLAGILGSTIVARFLYAFWREPIILFKSVFGKSSKSYFINYLIQFLIFIIVCSLTYAICYFITIDNQILEFVLKVAFVAIFPNVIFFIMFFKTKNFQFLFKRFIGIFKKNKQIDN